MIFIGQAILSGVGTLVVAAVVETIGQISYIEAVTSQHRKIKGAVSQHRNIKTITYGG
ncbi:hypothetical protein ES703_118439 [subsurface metagenome]